MSKFAKIIELENDEQVLLTVDYNNDDECFEVVIRAEFDGMTVKVGLGFNEKEKAEKMLHKYTKEDAEKFFNESFSFFKD